MRSDNQNGLTSMSDGDHLAMNGGLPPPDWQAVAPTIGLRSFAAIVLVVPLLLVAGVYWLHQLPSYTIGSEGSDNVIEVSLIGPQTKVEQQQPAPRPLRAKAPPPADPLIDDQNHSLPTESITPAPPEPEPTAPAAVLSAPAPSARSSHALLDQKAAMFLRELQSHIIRYRQDPDRRAAVVQLRFSMLRDGTVTGVWITSSSGDSLIDRAAIETIRRAQPMPRIPSGLPEQLDIAVPMTFKAS